MATPDDLATLLVSAAAEAIVNAKYPGAKGAPGARPFKPRPHDERYGQAATVAVLRVLDRFYHDHESDAAQLDAGALADDIEAARRCTK